MSIVVREFKDFLKEYKIVGFAIAFIMGAAETDLVKSFVNNIIMPLITPFVPAGAWQTATFNMGPIVILWGAFLRSLIYFITPAFVIFLVAKYVFKEEQVSKKQSTKLLIGT